MFNLAKLQNRLVNIYKGINLLFVTIFLPIFYFFYYICHLFTKFGMLEYLCKTCLVNKQPGFKAIYLATNKNKEVPKWKPAL